ncbi:MAG: ABC transporter permease [Nanoarchaeota archaeon]|nr:ABC transporter permease [Nanoarchaeota archaeon]
MEVIGVMIKRQLKRYWRSKPRLLGSFAQPLLFLFAFTFGFGPIYASAGEGNYIQFLAPGIMMMSVLFTSMFNGIEVIFDRQFGFLKETLVAPVSRTTILLGKAFGGALVGMIQGVIIFLITLLVGFRPEITQIPLAILFMALVALLFTSLGILIASRMEDMHAFPLIINFLLMPLFFLSGALFPIEGLKLVPYFNPLTYGVDGFRGALTGSFIFNPILGLGILSGCALVVIVIGAKLFATTEA